MENSNGAVKGPQKFANGINGLATPIDSHATKSRRKPSPKQRRGFLSRSFNLIARLLTWYSIFIVLFRCPATLQECTEDSPRGCKSYFQLKHTILPHLEPYYDSYGAPYVELARPYYDTFDQRVLTPGWAYAAKYGGPRITQAHEFGQAQWEKTVQPELTKYQALAKNKYDQNLAPHVEKISAAAAPYYDIARTNALQTYHDFLLPSYTFVAPYAQQAYSTASIFTTDNAIPAVVWAWNSTVVFVDGTIWPQLRYLYTENVEPQLVKISQRLGRHNASNTQKVAETFSSTPAEAASTVVPPTSLASSASATPVPSSADKPSTEAGSSDAAGASPDHKAPKSDYMEEKIRENEVVAPEVVPGESDVRRIARETVTQDLKDWQEKYAKAADEGAIEMAERIDEISKRTIDRQANVMGKALLKTLQKTIDTELNALRADIKTIIGQVKDGAETPKGGQDQITAAVRKAGMNIKTKSQDVRDWADNYEKELQGVVLKAAENHFLILSNIRDLALQKIGMKWAWMEGVTYKDWQKYHLLKDRFDEWEADLKELITNHSGLQGAEDAGRDVEAEAMELAQAAVKELASLRQVAGWKFATLDDSDEFDPDTTRSAAEEAAKAEAEAAAAAEEAAKAAAAEEAAKAEAEATAAEEAAAAEAEAATAADEAKAAEEETSKADAEPEDAAVQSAIESLSSNMEEVSSSIAPGQAPEEAKDTPVLDSTMILQETAPIGHSTEATEPAEAQDPADDELSPANERQAAAPTASVKPAFLGAAAQSVPTRQPVMDDDDETTFDAVSNIIAAMQSDVPATISSAASSAYSAAMSGASDRYSQAMSLVSAQISGTPKPAHEQYLASITVAYGEAVARASSGLDAALSAATGAFATPTASGLLNWPTEWANVESIAASKLSENQAWAAEQFENAKVAIGLATATPTDLPGSASSVASVAGESLAAVTAVAGENAQKLFQNAQHNYYAGLGVAQERYSQFLVAASNALSSMTATPTPTDLSGTISSAQSAPRESAGSAAAVGYENVASVAGAAGSFASEKWNAVLDELSTQIYGQPTPTAWYDNFYSAAGDYAASATDVVGSGADAFTSAAGSYASVASEEAAKQYVLVNNIISELLVGKEPTFSESVYSRLAGAYSMASSSAGNIASAASDKVVSVATEATQAAKEAVPDFKDEL